MLPHTIHLLVHPFLTSGRLFSREMDVLSKLVGGQGCGADGTASARNPLGELIDSFLDGASAVIPHDGKRSRAIYYL